MIDRKKLYYFFQSTWKYLIMSGVILTLAGFFSPWVDHQTAGLSITGFEMAEWIKFTPEAQSNRLNLQRAFFYWPPLVCAVGLAALTAFEQKRSKGSWLYVFAAVLLSLLPFPLLEEINNISGISVNAVRLLFIAAGLGSVLAAVLVRNRYPRIWSIFLMIVAMSGFFLSMLAFSSVEPIIERLYNHLIDPGSGFRLNQVGICILFISGAVRFF